MDDPPRGDERLESADFAPVRLGGQGRRGRWSPLVAGGWLVTVGAVVGLGLLGRSGATPGADAARTVEPAVRATQNPLVGGVAEPTRASDPDPVAFRTSTDATGVTISGTVLAREVVWVFISIQDISGGVVTWRSLSVEDPNGGIRPDKTPAFLVHVDLPRRPGAAALLIEINAYNDLGRKIGSVREVLGGPTRGAIHIGTSLVR